MSYPAENLSSLQCLKGELISRISGNAMQRVFLSCCNVSVPRPTCSTCWCFYRPWPWSGAKNVPWQRISGSPLVLFGWFCTGVAEKNRRTRFFHGDIEDAFPLTSCATFPSILGVAILVWWGRWSQFHPVPGSWPSTKTRVSRDFGVDIVPLGMGTIMGKESGTIRLLRYCRLMLLGDWNGFQGTFAGHFKSLPVNSIKHEWSINGFL